MIRSLESKRLGMREILILEQLFPVDPTPNYLKCKVLADLFHVNQETIEKWYIARRKEYFEQVVLNSFSKTKSQLIKYYFIIR